MSNKRSLALMLVPFVLLLSVGIAGAALLKLGAVKGATYTGVVHGETITLTTSSNGKSASVKLPRAPAFCSSGGGPERQHSKPATIGKAGSLTATISYTSQSSTKPFATVTVKGSFLGKLFDGTVKTAFTFADSKSCDGQASFAARTRK